jgi:endonuclease/exonuclease/phosphatase family metal-dependent hydrolase
MLKIMSLNLRFGLAADGPNRWERRKEAVAALLCKYPSDLIGFQEANDFQIDYLTKILSGYGCIGRRQPAPPFWQNNVIFFQHRWSCIANSHFFLSCTPDIPSRMRASRWPRQCTIGLFKHKHTGRVVACVNTHFDFDPMVQAASAVVVLQRLAATVAADLPAILLGDFNTGPDSRSHAILTGLESPPGLSPPSFKNIWQDPFPGTYHGFTGRPDGRHIDWILYRGPVTASGRCVIQEAFNDVYPSDHFPVRTDFSFEPV